VRIAAEASNGDVRLVVEDDGDGIPLARVEDAFRRYPSRGSRAGLHVGLSMARALVEAQGGSLSIEASTLEPTRADGPGVRFVVTLPGAK